MSVGKSRERRDSRPGLEAASSDLHEAHRCVSPGSGDAVARVARPAAVAQPARGTL